MSKRFKVRAKNWEGKRRQSVMGWMVPCPDCGGVVEGREGQEASMTGGCLDCGRVWHINDLPADPSWVRIFEQWRAG